MMTKEEMCEALAEDYADKVANTGGSYDDAFNHYLTRCESRTEKDLKHQFDVQGLSILKVNYLA